jgi:hypothetical protein
MNISQISRLLEQYDQLLIEHFPTAKVSREPTLSTPLLGEVEHLRWMIQETRQLMARFGPPSRMNRASRWLGFIEGSLVQLGLATIEGIQMSDVESFLPQ